MFIRSSVSNIKQPLVLILSLRNSRLTIALSLCKYGIPQDRSGFRVLVSLSIGGQIAVC
ncbi:hypothetical protein Golax_008601 [Gossypium laxum]|uniref:Uncharacterized protein n=1 Tax=Gossypium laxum TaxID=34288 RepID=A0A7J9AAE7_9ROSI|nr:hypothetical protein [Gossypium laxum]